MMDGLRKALAQRILYPKASVGVKNGLIGVWFHR